MGYHQPMGQSSLPMGTHRKIGSAQPTYGFFLKETSGPWVGWVGLGQVQSIRVSGAFCQG